MSVAQGHVIGDNSNRITLRFGISGVEYDLTAQTSPPHPPFRANNATLTYNGTDQLHSSASFNGRIGPDIFEFNFDNGVVARGHLDTPVVPAQMIQGTGVWRQ
ncbi:hypothetical protein FSPOR_1801 [Fusarium sporotrichioides]|jgi:hypothetical protein|uniref:Uncharacterized protein n=1 Tax=Fusarium sporotrichioides TaxID=5514 RepID=A0A395SP14_FUSSP|nr:hypothetical protein FSPOR_1801 [Fusarium sporotrichioides]